jgi:hypothetical protein
MSQPSKNYIDKVVRWSYGQVPLERMNFTPDQQFRARLCLECYRLFTENPSVPIRQLVQNIAARDYQNLVRNAELGNEDAAQMAGALGIRRDPDSGAVSVRRTTEIANDIFVINQLVGRLNVAKKHIHKAMYEDNISWMMQYGRKTGTWQAVKQANQDLARINADFKEDDDPQDQMPHTDLNITGDVSVVKEGRETLSDEEKARLRKKYGLTEKELAVQMQEINGIWEPVDDDADGKDYFEAAEEDLADG